VIVELPDDGSTIIVTGRHGSCSPNSVDGAPAKRRRVLLPSPGVHELVFAAPGVGERP
jgi:alpha-L-fucosidase 2